MTAEHWYTASGGEVRFSTDDEGDGDGTLVFVGDAGYETPLTDSEAVRLASELLREALPPDDWRRISMALRCTDFAVEQARLDESEARSDAEETR